MLEPQVKAALAKRVAKMPANRVSPEVRDAIATDYAGDMAPKAIAKKHRVSLVTVYKWIKRAAT